LLFLLQDIKKRKQALCYGVPYHCVGLSYCTILAIQPTNTLYWGVNPNGRIRTSRASLAVTILHYVIVKT